LLSGKLREHVDLIDHGTGTFIEIRAKATGNYIWCDPWWTDVYRIRKQKSERKALSKLMKDRGGRRKLKALLVSHTHGDHFADVPQLVHKCFDREHGGRLAVYGGANAQALICHFVGLKNKWKKSYKFYRTETAFQKRELTRRVNPSSAANRRGFGTVRNVDRAGRFDLPLLVKRDSPRYFRLKATPVRFVHSDVSPAFVGASQDLCGKPQPREFFCSKDEATACPMDHLLGFVFELFTSPGATKAAASFAIVPGTELARPVSQTLLDKYKNLDFYFHVPQASDFVTKYELPRDAGKSRLVHTAATKVHS
jgi:hypothetical protein